MNVNEKANRAGSWSVDLTGRGDSGTPTSLLRDLRAKTADRKSFVVVFPSEREPGSELMADAEYIGILETVEGKRSFGGAGVAALLGTDDGSGPIPSTITTADTLSNLVTALAAYAGLSVGTITDPGTATSSTYLWKIPDYVSTAREQLDKTCRYFGVQWRLIGDAIHVGTSAVLFPDRDRIITDELSGPLIGADVAVEPANVLTPALDASGLVWASQVFTTSGAAYVKATLNARPHKLNGSTLESYRHSDALDEPDADGQDIADRLLARWEQPRSGVKKIVTRRSRLWSRIRVGSRVWEWFPAIGVSDTGNVVYVGDEIVFPVERVVSEISVALEDSWAVYIYTTDGEWLNLSPWVRYGDGSAILSTTDTISIPSDADRFGHGSLKARVV